ncbi:MAG: I78 family peptidase inhibitor [Erythrobacter sp.]
MLLACAADKAGNPPPISEQSGEARLCNAEPAQYHLGEEATEARGAAILKDSNARSLRWGPPRAAWTMDYRQDRVNVQYDDKMVITAITCG